MELRKYLLEGEYPKDANKQQRFVLRRRAKNFCMIAFYACGISSWRDEMASSGRPLADLLRDVADQLESTSGGVMAANSSPQPPHRPNVNVTPNVTPRHPVDAEVSRLFGPYARGGRRLTMRRSTAVPVQLHSYTHLFCCLDDKKVSPQSIMPSLFQTNPEEFREFLLAAYPKLRQGGGFELLKISGTTRSRKLVLIPCPNDGYHVRFLKEPQTPQIGHATIFIRPLQRNLNLDPICGPECSSELVGPVQKCVTCGEEFSFSSIKAHSDECMSQTSDKGHEVHHQPTVEEHCVRLCVDVEST
ncbi:unnamed protein product [Leuciscus chuanchicus]